MTTLTPSISRLDVDRVSSSNVVPAGKLNLVELSMEGKNDVQIGDDNQLLLIHDAMKKGSIRTAIILSEQYHQENPSLKSIVTLAECFFMSSEYRRCLSILESNNLLSTVSIEDVVSQVRNDLENLHGMAMQDRCLPSIEKNSEMFSAICLAGQSLFSLRQYEDCLAFLTSVLDPLMEIFSSSAITSSSFGSTQQSKVSPLAVIHCTTGKCHDALENSFDAIHHLKQAVIIDVGCVDAVEYLISRHLLTNSEKRALFESLNFSSTRAAFQSLYSNFLLSDSTNSANSTESFSLLSCKNTSVPFLIRKAEILFHYNRSEEAYRLARQAYNMDPFDEKCLIIYIATTVDLGLKNELFYLGHELTNANPKSATAWYAVGCYYLCCKKYEMAQKYLQKATKLEKRFVYSWIALGHALSAQDESEHAINVYRTAMRLVPGNYYPVVLLARELAKSGNLMVALQLLSSAARMEPRDPDVLNEMAVVLLRMNHVEEAAVYLQAATSLIKELEVSSGVLGSKCHALEIINNYAFALRKTRQYQRALEFFNICLSMNPLDADVLLNLGYTCHLDGRFDAAISYYHRSLAIRPNNTLCVDLFHRANRDKTTYIANSEDLKVELQ